MARPRKNMASITGGRKLTATARVGQAALKVRDEVFGGLADIEAAVERESSAPHEPCYEVSVVVRGEAGMAAVGMVLDCHGMTEDAPVTVLKVMDGDMPRISSINI